MLGAPTLRLRGDYLAIVTLGFGEIIRIFLNNLNRADQHHQRSAGRKSGRSDPIGGIFSSRKTMRSSALLSPTCISYYYLFFVLTLADHFRLHAACRIRASAAPGWRSARTKSAAEAMGINTRNIKLLAFAMGATFGGVAGGLFASLQGFVSPESFR